MPDDELKPLIARAWFLHDAARGQDWFMKDSMPVLFFGDLYAYQHSPLRVVTCALNPSNAEFPESDPLARFPAINSTVDRSVAEYTRALSAYFQANPYRRWFNSYEQALRGLGASYYGTSLYTALHTDLGSCLPTKRTWSELEKAHRTYLMAPGVPLWQDLISLLQPQIILVSIARRWAESIDLDWKSEWATIATFKTRKDGSLRKKVLEVDCRWFSTNNGRSLLCFIPAANTPLGTLSHSQKAMVGQQILDVWRGSER